MTRSVPLVLLILSAAFLFTTCASMHPTVPPGVGPCANPHYDPHAPIICVHDSDLSHLSVTLDRAHMCQGATAHFWTDSGTGSLAIISSTLPADSIDCQPKKGHCILKIMGDAPIGEEHKYWAVVSRGNSAGMTPDPTIIIDTQ